MQWPGQRPVPLRRRASLLQVVGTDVHRVPFGHISIAILGHVGDHLQAGLGRADIGAAAEVFLDQIVLHGALQAAHVSTLFLGHCYIERQQPGRGGVDGHRGVHLVQRDLVKQGAHITQMTDRHPNLAHFTACQGVIAVVTSLGRQIKGD